MRRLESQGLLQSEWETNASKPRKYYVITNEGKSVLEKFKTYWYSFSESVNRLIEEDFNE